MTFRSLYSFLDSLDIISWWCIQINGWPPLILDFMIADSKDMLRLHCSDRRTIIVDVYIILIKVMVTEYLRFLLFRDRLCTRSMGSWPKWSWLSLQVFNYVKSCLFFSRVIPIWFDRLIPFLTNRYNPWSYILKSSSLFYLLYCWGFDTPVSRYGFEGLISVHELSDCLLFPHESSHHMGSLLKLLLTLDLLQALIDSDSERMTCWKV